MTHALFDAKRPKVLLDTNAVRDFFRQRKLDRDTRELARERFTALTDSGELRAVMTQPVLWELGSIVDDSTPGEGGWEVYEKVARFYVARTHRWRMAHEYERMRTELQVKMPLKESQVLSAAKHDAVLRDALTPSWIGERRANLERVKREERDDEAKKRRETAAEYEKNFGPTWRDQLAAEVSIENWENVIQRNVAKEMRVFARKNGLNMRVWPTPKAARTFWFSESFYLAKAKRVFVDNAKKELTSKSSMNDMPDLVDLTHLRDAAYVDILVSTDRRLIEVGRAARVPHLRLITFEEFGKELARA